MKGISYCVIRRKLEPLDCAEANFKRSVFLSSAFKCVGFSAGQPRIHQGNQIHGFGCPAFEIGTTWNFF